MGLQVITTFLKINLLITIFNSEFVELQLRIQSFIQLKIQFQIKI